MNSGSPLQEVATWKPWSIVLAVTSLAAIPFVFYSMPAQHRYVVAANTLHPTGTLSKSSVSIPGMRQPAPFLSKDSQQPQHSRLPTFEYSARMNGRDGVPLSIPQAAAAALSVLAGLWLFICRAVKRQPSPLSLLAISGTSDDNWEVKLLYDGDCPLCLREVRMLQNRNPRYGNRIKFVDIASPSYNPEENSGISFEEAMTKIHAILPNGEIITGIPVFVRLYECVGLGWVYRFVKVPGMLRIAEWLYNIWAKYRLQVTGRSDVAEMLDIMQRKTDDTASCRVPSVGMASAAAGRPEPPQWSELSLLLQSQQTDAERNFRSRLEQGKEHNALALLRLFGNDTEDDVRVTLYRDHAAWCPYCQKVWLVLEEKQISYRVEKINMRCYGDKPASYIRRFGQLLPAADIDGEGIADSNRIIEKLEATFPTFPLRPATNTPAGRRLSGLLTLEREVFGAWLSWLTSGYGEDRFLKSLDKVEKELAIGGGPYMLSGCAGMETVADGSGFSIVDIMFAPFLERIAASIPYFKGMPVRNNPRYPLLNAWYDAMDVRTAYAPTKSDFYTHCHDLPPQLGGCAGEVNPCSEEVDGTDGESWNLPLPETDKFVVEPFQKTLRGDDPAAARREAAERLIFNHVDVVRFASRGAGKPGFPPVMAELADPNATPAGAQVVAAVDEALRSVAQALLEGPNEVKAIPQQDPAVLKSLKYLQDRVGVPRDMSYAAARQLRAHIGWLMTAMENPGFVVPSKESSATGILYEDGNLEVTMYTTLGCTLCDKAKEVLQSCREAVPHTLRLVDIKDLDQDVAYRKFKYDIPVIFVDNKYFAKHRLEKEDTLTALQAATEGKFVARQGEPDSSDLD